MTLEFECEMAKCHDELQKAQNTNLKYYRIVERREKQLAELRETVAWYFETRENPVMYHTKRSKLYPNCFVHSEDQCLEYIATRERAEQQLRGMIDG